MAKTPEKIYYLYKDDEYLGEALTYEKLGFITGLSSTTMRRIHLGTKPDYGYKITEKKTKRQLKLEEERAFILSKPKMRASELADLFVLKYDYDRLKAGKKVSRIRNEEQKKNKLIEEEKEQKKIRKTSYKTELMPLCSKDPYGRMVWRISERGGTNARAYTNR